MSGAAGHRRAWGSASERFASCNGASVCPSVFFSPLPSSSLSVLLPRVFELVSPLSLSLSLLVFQIFVSVRVVYLSVISLPPQSQPSSQLGARHAS